MSRFISLSSTNRMLGMCFLGMFVPQLATRCACGLSGQAPAHGGRQFGQIHLAFGDDSFGLSAQNANILRGKLQRGYYDNWDIHELRPFTQLLEKLEA